MSPAPAPASAPRPAPAPRPRYLVLRRLSGELTLTTEADLSGGYLADPPRFKHVYSCSAYSQSCNGSVTTWVRPGEPGYPEDGTGVVAVKRKCACGCHTRKGAAEIKRLAAVEAKLRKDSAGLSFTFEGGQSKGASLARRVRRVSAAHQRRLHALDAKIAKLQRERTALIPATWGDGVVLTPAEIAKIGKRKFVEAGPSRRIVEALLEAKNVITPSGSAR